MRRDIVDLRPDLIDSRTFRVFVGTMYSGENEFARCAATIQSQTHVDVVHHIIDGKSELDAHHELYEIWMKRRREFDAFVQVDADTLLNDEMTLFSCVTTLKAYVQNGTTSVSFKLFDWLSQTSINGLNVYDPIVDFARPAVPGYADRCKVNDKNVTLSTIVGQHAPDPSFRQAFHYGLSRGFKCRPVNPLKEAWQRLGDDRRLMALMGHQAVHTFPGNVIDTNYTALEFDHAFMKACLEFKTFQTTLLR